LILFFGVSGFAQSKPSVGQLFTKYSQNPKDRDNLSELALYYIQINLDSANFYAEKLLHLSKKNEFIYLSRAYTVLGHVHYLSNRLDSAQYYHQKAVDVAKASKNEYAFGVNLSNLAQVYMTKGNINKCIETYLESEKILLKYANEDKADYYFSTMYSGLGEAYKYLALYDKSLHYLYKSFEYSKALGDETNMAITTSAIAGVYLDMKDYDKSEINYKKTLIHLSKVDYKLAKALTYYNLAEVYFEKNEISNTLKYLDSSRRYYILSKNSYQLGNIYNLTGKVNLKENNLDKAYQNFSIGLKYNQESNNLTDTGKSYESLGDYYNYKNSEEALNYYKKALEIFDKGNLLKDKKAILEKILNLSSVINNPELSHTYFLAYQKANASYLNEEKQKAIVSQEVLYETELKEAKIKTQELELIKEKDKQKNMIYGTGFLVTIGLLSFYVFYNQQRKNQFIIKNTILNLQNNLNQMELQNLNQQLNPHEFKNLLIGIAPEIQQKAPEAYKNMIRLLNITKEGIKSNALTDSVENQLEHLKSFLILEQNIASHPFEWNIDNDLKVENFQIPRLILKNAVDNAIKHGIKNIEKGKINIKLYNDSNSVYISIKDNGVGKNKQQTKSTGIGIVTYQKLFETLNQKNSNFAIYEVRFAENGTNVAINIPLNYIYI